VTRFVQIRASPVVESLKLDNVKFNGGWEGDRKVESLVTPLAKLISFDALLYYFEKPFHFCFIFLLKIVGLMEGGGVTQLNLYRVTSLLPLPMVQDLVFIVLVGPILVLGYYGIGLNFRISHQLP